MNSLYTKHMKKNLSEALGIDLGDTIFTKENGVRFPFRGSYRVIKRLIEERFKEKSFIVSRVTPEQKIRALAMLKEDGFHELTGLPPKNVEFCELRHEKAPICERLGITHFIDDRPEVMSHMEFVPHRFLFRPIPEDVELFKNKLEGVTIVQSWAEIEKLLL